MVGGQDVHAAVAHERRDLVGEFPLAFEGLGPAAEPGSPSEVRLRLLGSWAATEEADVSTRHSGG
ncbi:hypothetical protein BIV25_22525 [Streptomyces sp. MUSC 14]|uniref:hypothetical protein n=1 Tax=Streptomyces sp. MUSC 14 TaxID=1354889 RepID=UPI0008F5BA75|nr:hypothetical protein [Streptomyces sp. MUSC 14]OIJ94382.1 hypothetical protein BIV25_22525 [Streptomyces sp. MUSC 14]